MDNTSDSPTTARYKRLLEILCDLASILDLNSLLNQIVSAAAELSLAEAASILLYDEPNRQLYFQAATNLSEPMRAINVPLENSIAGWIITNQKPMIVNDVSRCPFHFKGIAKATDVLTQSLLGVPLITQHKVIGVLEAINKQHGLFVEEDQDLLMALAAQAAISIENARLFQQSDLIAELVHELRTPLASMTIATQFLQRPNISVEQHQEMIASIQRETVRLNEMTTAFLDLARLESGRTQFQLESFDLNKLLEECTDLVKQQAKEQELTIQTEIPTDMFPVRGDRPKLKQAFLNLLNNAIKYNRPNGSITIEVITTPTSVRIMFQDTGWGIPEKDLPHIFEKFYRGGNIQDKVSGTGLGLTITKRIIDYHGGHIEVRSQHGVGTNFIVRLPLSPGKN
ncbi:MAG: GAF domain-containing sensor histidine kinase [Chloroflexota bacterium]